MSGNGVLFHEIQEFRRLWFALLILPGAAALVGIFGFGMYRQLGRGIPFGFTMYRQFGMGVPFGSDPMPDSLLWILGPIMILIGFSLIFLFLSMRLIVMVKKQGLFIRYVPFVNRRISFTDIQRCYAKTYNALREYGGWGIRGGKKRRAYNVRGNRGVMLHFKDGTSLLIGSQKADELADAITRMI